MLRHQNNNIPLQTYYFSKPHISNDEQFYDDVSSNVKCVPRVLEIMLMPVSYTHLTLPTNREV